MNLDGTDLIRSKKIVDRTRILLSSDTSTNTTENLWKTTESHTSKKSKPYIRKYIIIVKRLGLGLGTGPGPGIGD